MKRLLFISLLALFVVACNDDQESLENQNSDTSNLGLSLEVDEAENILGDLTISAIESYGSLEEGRSSIQSQSDLPGCLQATYVLEQNQAQLTLDFGTEGCYYQGYVIQGQVVMNWVHMPDAAQVLVQSELVDFYIDEKEVQGTSTILYEISNDNGHPQSTHTLNLTVIWPNGQQVEREGEKVREWIEGFETSGYTDNVFLITGHWTSVFLSEVTHQYEVLEPLRREGSCDHFVSGSVDVQRPIVSGVFNFGDGTCDNLATFTLTDGTVVDVVLNW